jgi:hypothetical protein
MKLGQLGSDLAEENRLFTLVSLSFAHGFPLVLPSLFLSPPTAII